MSINIKSYSNATCLKCDCVEKHMISVGCFIMCKKCYKEEFSTLNNLKIEIDTTQFEKYKYWLNVFNHTYY